MIKHTAICSRCNKTLELVVLECKFEVQKVELSLFEYLPHTTERTIHLCFNCYDEISKTYKKDEKTTV